MAEENIVVEREESRVGTGTFDPRPLPAAPRISWAAIFGGAVAALGLWVLLYAFGLAVGLSSMDPNDPHSARGSGIFTGVWGGVAPLIALFIGGLVAARLAGVFLRGYGALHGLVMWGLVTLSGVLMVFTVVSSVVAGGAATVGRSVTHGGGAALKGMGEMGLDWDDLIAPVNQRLQAQGKPAVTAAQLQEAAKDSLRTSVRAGHFDRNHFESALAQNTALTRADVQEIGQKVEGRFDQVVQAAKLGALKAADVTGKAFFGVFGALALGLLAALLGGVLGVPRVGVLRGAPTPGPRTVTTETTTRGPIVPPREAYRRT